ncbi:carbohydrate ABC transporter membrane protein 1 (CUT1 family) [Rhizobium sp. PP-F2F-G38]|uniref:Sugar ABC transporter permease n=1 Tax=Ferranicluibacter rubi TaxID=2715133 RepID=A0AA43ZI85_9HYPH|nr:sugar ABC transporter permease [Ferranicluibacter rubi]PYE34039.1 carbohydrate ABC transporter membrane protein 1 (CUT1 family) [Rhizobium sp. PP-WC-1G-195]PYE96675.1 carbohydrate ABC transporter membrane protein 1 (CUT1 family) [Rhizobium sp. PP-F2F-G38]TCP86087.1 carbohydrate ABC transporter membrane protein 1 (CUT1 family) [Rhizobium sp. PP-CC-2G-626]TCQ23640.1 carbohydrate ABC transporter membrane protein 1 (CUT1 family) [Rhizobium sp. PP-CC-3G-465]NHT77362.1 sugar ABC transporter perme
MSAKLARREHRTAWLFLTPLVVVMLMVAVWPLGRTFFFSFTDAYLDDPTVYGMVGISNFLEVINDPAWWSAVRNTLTFAVISVAIETLLGLGIALLLNEAIPGRGLLRAAILVPWAIPVVVATKIWEWMLNDQFGVFNRILISLGLIDHGIAWTASSSLIMGVVIFIDVWMTTPFMVLLILAGLQTIPGEMMEAAEVDGIPAWKRFWSITLPLLKPAIGVAVLFRSLDAIRMFDLAYVLAASNQNVMTVSIYARDRLISFQELGVGSAASTWVFLLVALVAIILIGALRLDRSAGE